MVIKMVGVIFIELDFIQGFQKNIILLVLNLFEGCIASPSGRRNFNGGVGVVWTHTKSPTFRLPVRGGRGGGGGGAGGEGGGGVRRGEKVGEWEWQVFH